MRIIFLNDTLTAVLCFLLWPLFQVGISIACLKIKDQKFNYNKFPYKTYKWEKEGKIYDKIFKVSRWKKFLPDGGAIMKGGYKKKNITDFSRENFQKFVIESCRAELSHLLAIFPFWVFGLFAPIEVIYIMLAYALLVNLPCIITQRYNRPRFIRLINSIR